MNYDLVDAQDRAEQIQDAFDEYKENHNWISVKDRLPKNGVKVLVLHHKDKFEWLRTDQISIGYLGMDCTDMFIVGGAPRYIDDKHDHITHWMPLPQPPKEE